MPNSPRAVRRRILWMVILIVFMVALAALYMVLGPRHRSHHAGAVVSDVSAHGP